jgi:hypothetical protein
MALGAMGAGYMYGAGQRVYSRLKGPAGRQTVAFAGSVDQDGGIDQDYHYGEDVGDGDVDGDQGWFARLRDRGEQRKLEEWLDENTNVAPGALVMGGDGKLHQVPRVYRR